VKGAPGLPQTFLVNVYEKVRGWKVQHADAKKLWRRDRDSNPRYVAVHLISSQVKTPFQTIPTGFKHP